MKTEKELLEDILVAQTLTLAMAMKTNDNVQRINHGGMTTNDFIRDAAAQIKREKSKVLELLNEIT